jgi:hypothetical protein
LKYTIINVIGIILGWGLAYWLGRIQAETSKFQRIMRDLQNQTVCSIHLRIKNRRPECVHEEVASSLEASIRAEYEAAINQYPQVPEFTPPSTKLRRIR